MMTSRTRQLIAQIGAAALLGVVLAGCSPGASTFGNNKLPVATVPNMSTYTAEGALIEARNHFANGDYGYSAAFYKRTVELSPKDPEAFVGLAASYDRLRRFDLSDRVYAKLHDLVGGSVQYHNNVGYSYMLRGDLRAALKAFRMAAAIDPDNAVVANNIQMIESRMAKAKV